MKTRKLALSVGAGLLLSVAGLAHVKHSEGLRFTSYPDPATRGAPYTICYGHTGPEVKPGMTVSKAQCDKWLDADLKIAQNHLLRMTTVPLRQGEVDAYTSFIFNVGPENFRTSTMRRKLNAGDWLGACQEFPKWKYANKIVLDGIVKRRYEELTMCVQGGPYVVAP